MRGSREFFARGNDNIYLRASYNTKFPRVCDFEGKILSFILCYSSVP